MNTNRGERLSRYAHPQRNQLFPDVLDDFNDVVQRAPEKVIAQAMAAAFRADENTPFAPIVANSSGIRTLSCVLHCHYHHSRRD